MLPSTAAINGGQNRAVDSGRYCREIVERRNLCEMFVGPSRLCRPCHSAVDCFQDPTIRARCPTGLAGERYGVEMILRIVLRRTPVLTSVVCRENAPAGADNDGILFVFYKYGRKRQIQQQRLSLPREAAVLG